MLPARGVSVRIRPSTIVNAIGTWVWPCRPCSVEIADRPARARAAEVTYSQVGSRGLPWTSVKAASDRRWGSAASQARVVSEMAVRVHSMAARASALNQSSSIAPLAAASWLPRTPVAPRAASRSTTPSGSGP